MATNLNCGYLECCLRIYVAVGTKVTSEFNYTKVTCNVGTWNEKVKGKNNKGVNSISLQCENVIRKGKRKKYQEKAKII